MIELDLMDNEISLYLNWQFEFPQEKLKNFQVAGHYPPLLYFDRHNKVYGEGSLWLNFLHKLQDHPFKEAWIFRDIPKVNPHELDEIRFWIQGSHLADGSDDHPYYFFFTLDTFKNRGIYWAVPITQPGKWEMKRITLRGEIQERILGRKMYLTKLDEPQRASRAYFYFRRPDQLEGRDLHINLDYLLAFPERDQSILSGLSRSLEQFFREIEKELKIRFDVIPDPTPQDLKQGIKNLTVRIQNAGVQQNWPRGNFHRQKSNFIYRFSPPASPELLSFATRPPACPYDVSYYIEILAPKEKEKHAEALQIRNGILKKIAAHPYLWFQGERIPLTLVKKTSEEPQPEEKNLEDTNALKIKVSSRIETGDWEFHILDKLRVEVTTSSPRDPYTKGRESVFDLSYILRLQGYSQEQASLMLDHLQRGRNLREVRFITPLTSPPLIQLSYPGSGSARDLLKYLKGRLKKVASSLRPEKVSLTQQYNLEIVEIIK